MNREIRFRAWNKLAHKMAVIDALDFAFDAYRAHAGKFSGSGHLADIELMQFTGLKDKQGKDIYEGDIVVDARWDARFEVKWCDGKGEHLGGQLGWILDDERFCDVGHTTELEAYLRWDETSSKEEYYNGHVIGNIYENGDLLK